jgi:hypothetical protein
MFVVDFNDRVVVEPLIEKLHKQPCRTRKALKAVSAHGRTALYDAVAEGRLICNLVIYRESLNYYQ